MGIPQHEKRLLLRALGGMVMAGVLLLLPVRTQAFCYEEAGAQHGINPQLLESIARVESGLNPKAVNINRNGTADFGLMQINSTWMNALQLDREALLSDPCYNVMTGARILGTCIDRWGYTWEAVGCYNATARSRQVHYAWKIYRELKKEAAKKTQGSNKKEFMQGPGSFNRSFHFRVRDVHEPEISEKP